MRFAPITRSAISENQLLRKRAGGNSLAQVLLVVLLAVLAGLGIGLAMLPRAGHAEPARPCEAQPDLADSPCAATGRAPRIKRAAIFLTQPLESGSLVPLARGRQ